MSMSFLSKGLSPFQSLYSSWTSMLEFHHRHYARFETYILKGEHHERFRMKKSILLYHCYLVIVLFILIPILNRQASLLKSVGNVISALIQMRILQGNNYKLIGTYVYIHSLIGLTLQYVTDGEPLTIMGLILANQHMFFLFPENVLVGKLYIPLVLGMIGSLQNQLLIDISNWNIDKVELNTRGFCYSWPVIFLFHHYGAQNLTTSYRLALIGNMDIQHELKNTLTLLEKTNEDLKGALQSRELFIASVSHELRNPLNCMIGNIELLRLDIKNEKWLKALDTCKLCSEVLLGQINNVLDVAKINAEKLELHLLPGNFHRLIEKVWTISSIPIKQKKLKGEIRISKDFPKYIEMDSHRLTQILLNLIGNASKFAKEGSVTVTITWHQNQNIESLRRPCQEYISLVNNKKRTIQSTKTTPRSINLDDQVITRSFECPSIEIYDPDAKIFAVENVMQREFQPKVLSQILNLGFIRSSTEDINIESQTDSQNVYSHKENGFLKIEVIDTGMGISQESLKDLFQAFKQADSSITRQFGGTGLGLYITKQIVQKMGGEIHAYSHENVGSDFCVLIPAQTTRKEEVKEETDAETLRKEEEIGVHGLKALVVDDITGNQLVLSSYLKRLNIQSDTAMNGLEALELFKAKGPNYYSLITMDLQMPIMDGLTASRQIRTHEAILGLEDTPIIVITGNCADTEKNNCVDPKGEIRAFNFHRKPFTFDECRSTVQNILAKKNLDMSQRSPPRVMIVDDDAFNTTVTQEYFEKHGFYCVTSANGKDAVATASREQFDVILMDCEMPEMDGYTAARHIKRTSPKVQIIGVTGHRREECLKKCLESGMNDVETKPIDFAKLVRLIKKECRMTR